MRVFVVGTGRCGTCTFYQAAKHITNYTVGHESAAGRVNWDADMYPDNHIEIAGHLSMTMGYLRSHYPGASWVHLQRLLRQDCIRSLASQSQVQLDAFARHWFQAFQADPLLVAERFYDTINANIHCMLPKRREQRMTIFLEEANRRWADFWKWIGAEGDFEKSLAEWGRKYNATDARGRDNFVRVR